jgi:hypothetical protein
MGNVSKKSRIYELQFPHMIESGGPVSSELHHFNHYRLYFCMVLAIRQSLNAGSFTMIKLAAGLHRLQPVLLEKNV